MNGRAALGLAAVVLIGLGLANSPAGGSGGGGSGSAGCVAELRSMEGFDRAQLKHANTIAETAIEVRMRHRHQAVVVALATALQESGLHNLPYGDRDSVGLFQQRSNWGTYAERMDPRTAAKRFYHALKRVDGWWNMPVTAAAQAVQISAFPYAYAQHEWKARRLADRLLRNC